MPQIIICQESCVSQNQIYPKMKYYPKFNMDKHEICLKIKCFQKFNISTYWRCSNTRGNNIKPLAVAIWQPCLCWQPCLRWQPFLLWQPFFLWQPCFLWQCSWVSALAHFTKITIYIYSNFWDSNYQLSLAVISC